jgi:hypothetical protein
MPTAKVLRAKPRDVIAHAWYHLGYRPTDSLVLVAVRGPRLRLGVVLRVDLPPPTLSRQLLHHIAQQLAIRLSGAGASATVALVMSARALKSPPFRLIRTLREVLLRRRIEMIDVIGVTPRRFRSLICPAYRCCPRSGEPVASVLTSNVSLAHILSGEALADHAPDHPPRRSAATSKPPPAPEQSPEPPGPPDPPPVDPPPLPPKVRETWWRVWVAAFDAGHLAAEHQPGFALALADEVLRDAVLATSMGAPTHALEPPAAPDAAPAGLTDVPGARARPRAPHQGRAGRRGGSAGGAARPPGGRARGARRPRLVCRARGPRHPPARLRPARAASPRTRVDGPRPRRTRLPTAVGADVRRRPRRRPRDRCRSATAQRAIARPAGGDLAHATLEC